MAESIRAKFPRVLGLSTFDVAGTMLLAYGLAERYEKPFWQCMLFLTAVGEAVHLARGVETPITSVLKGRKVHYHDGSHIDNEKN